MVRLLIGLALAAAPAASGAQEWRQAREVELRLSNFDVQPPTLRLRSGQPVRLRLVNATPQYQRLSAPAFFAASALRSRDAAAVAGGRVGLPGGATRELLLVPSAGHYRLRSSNVLVRLLGMSGQIVVE